MSQNFSQSTAILIFIRSSQIDAEHKNIAGGERLFNALNEHFIQMIKGCGLPYVIVTAENQVGDTFGERFSNALAFAFEKGYENIIAIGNDTPHLTNEIIADAIKELEEEKTVIGPSVDGGFYLLGIHHSNFDCEKFKKLSWQTPKIIREIQKIVEEKGKKHISFSTLFDIDCLYDLKIFINQDNNYSKHLYEIAKDIFDTTVSKYLFVEIFDERLPEFRTSNQSTNTFN